MTAPSGNPRTYTTSAFPGAPGVPGGGDDAPAPPIRSGVVGDNDYLAGGSTAVDGQDTAFPGVGGQFGGPGQAWQDYQTGPVIDPSTVNDQPGHVSGGVRSSSPKAFFGDLGQGV